MTLAAMSVGIPSITSDIFQSPMQTRTSDLSLFPEKALPCPALPCIASQRLLFQKWTFHTRMTRKKKETQGGFLFLPPSCNENKWKSLEVTEQPKVETKKKRKKTKQNKTKVNEGVFGSEKKKKKKRMNCGKFSRDPECEQAVT